MDKKKALSEEETLLLREKFIAEYSKKKGMEPQRTKLNSNVRNSYPERI